MVQSRPVKPKTFKRVNAGSGATDYIIVIEGVEYVLGSVM